MESTQLHRYDLYEAIRKFSELTGWEAASHGEWNCKFDKPFTFSVSYEEQYSFHYEQDYIYYPHHFCYGDSVVDVTTPETVAEWISRFHYDPVKYWQHLPSLGEISYSNIVGTYDHDGHTLLKIPMSVIVQFLISRGEVANAPVIFTTM
jgi:hypothetical protein